MKTLISIFVAAFLIIGCSKPERKTEKNTLPIYVSFDKTGARLFGPIPLNSSASLSDGWVIPGTDHTINVYGSALSSTKATLVFQEVTPTGGIVKQAEQKILLGLGYTFKIFDSVDVTIRNKPNSLP